MSHSLLDSDDEEISNEVKDIPVDYVLGIDLGTSNTCVSIWRNKSLEVIPDEYGNRTFPSVVAFTNKTKYVGLEARNQIELNPENSYYDIKRLIGRKYSDESVQNDKQFFTFDIDTDQNDNILIKASLERRKRTYTPEELSAQVLVKAKTMAEAYLNTTVNKAIITVPAYFNDAQRQATKDASTIAGLECLRVLSEPTAAALAYGIKKSGETNVLVYDCGAGTTDVSILNVGDGIFQVMACTGNTHLGGEDFDNRLITHSINTFKKKNNLENIQINNINMQKLKKSCENAKKTLSMTGKTIITVDDFCNNTNLYLTITRQKFEQICQDLFILAMKPIDDVLKSAGIAKDEIAEIILVGGTTRMPKIKELITTYFGKKPNDSVNPDEVVSAGAAIQGYILINPDDPFSKSIGLVDVMPLSLGIETTGGLMNVIIPRNSAIPITKRKKFTTDTDNMTKISINIYEGERKLVKDNFKVGTFELTGIDPVARGIPEIEITFKIDINGIISVQAIDKKNELNKNSIMITSNKGRLTNEQIKELINEAKKHELDDRLIHERKMLHNELTEIYHNIMANLADDAFNLTDNDKNKISEDIKQVKQFLDLQSENKQEYKNIIDRLRKNYAILVLRAKKEFDNIKAQDSNHAQSTSVYEDDEENMIYENIDNDEDSVNRKEEIKKLRDVLSELCYSIYETLNSPMIKMKPEHITELKDYIDDVLLWIHIKDNLTEQDLTDKMTEVNESCDAIFKLYEEVFETQVNTAKDTLEQLCYQLKCGLQNNMFSIRTDENKLLYDFIENCLTWLFEHQNESEEIYLGKQQELNKLCDEYYNNMVNFNINQKP